MSTPIRSLRSVLPSAFIAALSLTIGLHDASAQSSTNIAQLFPIGLDHAKAAPYNFTGRVYNLDAVAVGTGTLIRRHTVLTAAHVIYDPTNGFGTNSTFTRALYDTFSLSKGSVASVNVLAGYQALASTDGSESNAAAARDLGYLILSTPPVDENWTNFLSGTAANSALTDNSGRFVLGYPTVTFDARTMAYAVPTTPFVQVGNGDTGSYQNEELTAEGGMSGGPIYSVQNGVQQVVAELTSGLNDPTGSFNFVGVRSINKEAGKFLVAAEYTSGLIKKVKVTGPTTVTAGSTAIYTATVKFTTPTLAGAQATTDRYSEVNLKSDVVSTPPAVTVTKIAPNQFQVTFGKQLRSGSRLNLVVQYSKNAVVPKSSIAVTIK